MVQPSIVDVNSKVITTSFDDVTMRCVSYGNQPKKRYDRLAKYHYSARYSMRIDPISVFGGDDIVLWDMYVYIYIVMCAL